MTLTLSERAGSILVRRLPADAREQDTPVAVVTGDYFLDDARDLLKVAS